MYACASSRPRQGFKHRLRRARCTTAALGVIAFGLPSLLPAQDIEPRAYSNAPVGVNFLVPGYVYTRGGASIDSALPVSNPELTTSSALLGYGRVFALWGQSAKLNVILPVSDLNGTAEFAGMPEERSVSGLADPLVKLSVNLYGAPALSLEEFAGYRQDLIVGASLRVSAPWGQYDDTKAVNIGSNRWSLAAELGASKALGSWTLEAAGAVTLFTDNDDFFHGNTLSQDPIYTLQGHLIYSFNRGIWGSLDGTWFAGGETALNGERRDDRQENRRLGATLALPVSRRNSLKLYASSGVSARTGNNYDLLGIAWQYRWGAGL